MATGPEHYREAESEHAQAAMAADDGRDDWQYYMASAQLHATLALAAATATNVLLQLPLSSDIGKPWAQAVELPGGAA